MAGELRRYQEEDEVRDEDVRRVKLRGTRADTTYLLRTIRVRMEADGRFFLTDPHTRRIVAEFDVSAAENAEYKRGSYDGDVSTLDLPRREQDYFGAHLRENAVLDAQDRLLEKLAEQIARRSFEAALHQIP